MPRLVVLEGPNRGAVMAVTAGVNIVGRDGKAQISFPDPSISRRHAKLILDPDDGPMLTDLGSTNATYVNGVQITAPHALSNGDEVRFGDTTVLFLTDNPTADEVESGAASMDDTSKLLSAGAVSGTAGPRASRSRGPELSRARARYMVGDSPALKRVSELVARCASLESTVLIQGESGTGKELVAEALHRLGPRRDQPFIVINCATLEPALLESELFGHERGAFTGAVARKLGKLELVRGGTLFLDEVGELPPAAQAKLLRAIDRREYTRLGGHDVLTTNARFVAATHRDLNARVRDGEFREDLLFRLRVVEISLPPLRERPEDIGPLVQHFIQELREKIPTRARNLAPAAADLLLRYRFPGNARELRNIIERCLIFCEREVIEVADLPHEVRAGVPMSALEPKALAPQSTPSQGMPVAGSPAATAAAPDGEGIEGIGTLEDAERTQIRRALTSSGWNKSKAAKILAIDRNTLHSKMKRFGIAEPPVSESTPPGTHTTDEGSETMTMKRPV